MKHRRNELTRERTLVLQQIYSLQQRSKAIEEELQTMEKEIEERELVVTDHAIQRFRERVADLPRTQVKKILTNESLLKAYREKGDGRYVLEELPYVVVVVKDFAVITVISTDQPEEKLRVLKEYMEVFVEDLASKLTGNSDHVMKLRTFRKLYYKNLKTTTT